MSPPGEQTADSVEGAVTSAAGKAVEALLSRRRADGSWLSNVSTDVTADADYILLQFWLYPPENGKWDPPTHPLIQKAAAGILARQLPVGGFGLYSGGPAELNPTIK